MTRNTRELVLVYGPRGEGGGVHEAEWDSPKEVALNPRRLDVEAHLPQDASSLVLSNYKPQFTKFSFFHIVELNRFAVPSGD